MPAAINIVALNIAWVSKWKKHMLVIPNLKVLIIRPNCLIVERAIVSLISFFDIAHAADINIVIIPVHIKIGLKYTNSDKNL